MWSTTQARGQPEASISYWTATSQSGRSPLGRELAPARHGVEELRLAVRLADDRQERRGAAPAGATGTSAVSGRAAAQIRLDGQCERVQDAAPVDAHRLRVEHVGELGPEPLELLRRSGPPRVLHQQHEGVADASGTGSRRP